MTTTKLQLPEILGSQDQKHVTHNEALFFIDQLCQLSVVDKDLSTPPGSPTEGNAYIVAATGTGDWASHDKHIAIYDGDGWVFSIPQEGWFAWVADEGEIYNYVSGTWTALGDVLGADYLALAGGTVTGETIFNISGERARINQYGLGVGGAAADASNQFAFYGTDMLFNSGGSIGAKFNKNGAGDDATFTFQQGYTAYAQMGLAGDNDWTLKVGTGFNIAIAADNATGDVTFPNQTSVRAVQPFGGRWYCYTDNRWTGPLQYVNAENRNASGGTGATPNIDWDARGDHYLPAGSVIKSLTGSAQVNNTEVTDIYWKLYFQYPNTWDGLSNTSGEFTRIEVDGGTLSPANNGFFKVDFLSSEYTVPADGHLLLVIKPNGTLTANRYFYVTGLLDVLLNMS